MRITNPSTWKIGSRLMVVAAIPALLIATILTTYHLASHFEDESQHVHEYGHAIAGNSGTLAELGIISADVATLDQLAQSVTSQQDVVGVAFFDDTQRLLLARPNELPVDMLSGNLEFTRSGTAGEYLRYFVAPVSPSMIEVADFRELTAPAHDAAPENPVVGWVAVYIDESASVHRQWDHVRNAMAIGVLGLLLAFFIAKRVANTIVRPLHSVTRTVEQIASGDLKARSDTSDSGELGKLQSGVNQMAELIDGHSESMQQEVEEATERLQLALSKLELRNADLVDANNAAEAANAAKDEFVARMSHELRTPITSITGFMELVRNTALTGEQMEFIDIATQASNSLLGTINDILGVSELRQREFELQPNEFELETALDNMIAIHAWSAFDKGVELVINIDQDVPRMVIADQVRLIQICNNLVANSVKFTEEGQVVVSVSLLEESTGQVLLEFLVRDSGIGIEKSHLEKIFEPFYQGDTSIRRRYGGTGLGLMIARSMVEKLGGELNISSQPGQGTEVSFTILATVSESRKPGPAPADSGSVLLCDSNLWSQRSIRNRVLSLTHNVYVCDSLQRLRHILETGVITPARVLVSFTPSDSNAEAVTGFLDYLKNYYSGHVACLLSSLHMEAIEEATRNAPFASLQFVRKPVTNDKLYAALSSNQPDTQNAASSVPAISAGGVGAVDGLQGCKVLLAEDNRHNRKLIELLLRKAGIKVTAVEDGEQALAALQRDSFDLAMLDLHMPGLDGLEVARRYREASAERAKPVVLLTADLVARNREQLESQGIAAVLYKPLDQRKLWSTLFNLLRPGIVNPQEPAQGSGLLDIDPVSLRHEMANLLDQIERELQENNPPALAEYTHQLRGLTGLASRNSYAELCFQLDEAVRHSDRDARNRIIIELKDMLDDKQGD